MIRKILGTLVMSSLLAAGANATTITFMGPTDTIEPGQSFDVTVSASGFTEGLFGAAMWITYDANLVTLDRITLNNFGAANFDGSNSLDLGFSCTTALSSAGTNDVGWSAGDDAPFNGTTQGCLNPPQAGAFSDPDNYADGNVDPNANAYVLLAGQLSNPNILADFLNPPDGADAGLLMTLSFTAVGDAAEALTAISGVVAALGGGFLNTGPPGENEIPAGSVNFIAANVDVNTAVIPLPAAVWLMFGGVASLLGFRRK
ncbi:MAG: hypothetical protein KJO54_00265 [Gammaproteobacteria bacterium]|nr:hypothetical protein [Gammaproteobacteria bacterium]NNF62545.1 hypothetical protein [Gammaproteobacteria bacterium]NNM20752.1 hypothetical protein [Gammaproteobacteria bacterium]